MRKVEDNKQIVEILEEVKIGDIILEKGDKIEVLIESVMQVGEQTISDVCRVVQLYNQSYSKNKNIIRYTPDLFKKLVLLNLKSYAERYNEEVDTTLASMLKMKQPSSDISQLAKSLDNYTYQIEGSAENSDEFKGLQFIENDFINVIRSTKEYDNGYWGD